ncbi:MAG: ADP-ribosylglycohydrolase family protein [Clostridiales bacterium]|jgi:ADP-ribosyl-[dinitrogen reductase] hydrolase|nr:ADP-ribosylglycohydrolase family protein [Clostridiales bacterium]
MKNKNRVLGALLGVAVGDALGAPLEFMSAEEIQATHGGSVRDMIGDGWLDVAPGEVTDDTQMTLAVAEGIALCPNDPVPAIGKRFLAWYDSKPKDIGNCCREAIEHVKRSGINDTSAAWHVAAASVHEKTGGQTAGNGALMRTVYPGLYYPPSEAHFAASVIAKMTHWHDESTMAVILYTMAISDLVAENEGIREGSGEIAWGKAQIERRMVNVRKRAEGKKITPSGYAINSAVCAINAIRDTGSFEDALVQAVNLGGDADTIGAITGGLAGALYGADAIPQRWVKKLDKGTVKRIEKLAEKAR